MSLRRNSSRLGRCVFLAALLVMTAGCGKTKLGDPGLQQIQEILDAQLPQGSTRTMVNQFVTMRGYPVEPSGQADQTVVIIRHIDQQKLKPVTARVTFYFDSTDKLIKTELVRTLNQSPVPAPAEPDSQPQSAPPTDNPAPSN